MRRRGNKWLVVLAFGTVALLVLVPAIFHLAKTAYRDRTVIEKLPAGFTDDVSRLDTTKIAEIWDIPSDAQKGEDGCATCCTGRRSRTCMCQSPVRDIAWVGKPSIREALRSICSLSRA
jgi:hypothetical protein